MLLAVDGMLPSLLGSEVTFLHKTKYYNFNAIQYNSRCTHLNQIQVRKSENDYLSAQLNSEGFLFCMLCTDRSIDHTI